MKKLLVLFLVSVTILVMSCEDNPEEANPLIGTWEGTVGDYTLQIIEFFNTTYIFTVYYQGELDHTSNGTYQFYNDIIIFRPDTGYNYLVDVIINNNEMTITRNPGNAVFIFYKK